MSLEAKQALNNTIIQNAQFQAARQTLGLTEPEMLAAVSRQQRRQARADQQFDPNQYLRQISQSEKTTKTDVGRQELDGLRFLDSDENDAGFGQMQDDLQTFSADDRGYIEDEETGELRRSRLTDDKPVEMGEFPGITTKRNSYTNKLFPADYTREEPLGFIGQNAPKTALVDALNALNAGTSQYGYDAFPGSLGVASNLEQSIGGMAGGSMFTGPKGASGVRQGTYSVNKPIDLEAERSLASDLLIQDRSNYNPRMRAENDEAVGHLADTIARLSYTVNGPGAMADESIGRIGEIRRLGAAGSLGDMEQTTFDFDGPKAVMSDAEEIVDNTGRIVGYADPVTKAPIALDPALGISLATQGANTPDAGQMMNAPQNPQTAREWAASNLPAMVQDTGSTPPRYPQANITKETTNYSNELARVLSSLGIKGRVNPNVRNIEEIDRAAKAVQKALQDEGDILTMKNPDKKSKTKNIPAGTQIISGLMSRLDLGSGEQERLANSLFALDAAKRSSVNQNPTGTYLARENTAIQQPQLNLSAESYKGVTPATAQALVENERRKRTNVEFDSPSEGFGSIPIAQMKAGSSVTARNPITGKIGRKDIVSALGGLNITDGGAQAQKPYIGMPADAPTKDTVRTPMEARFLQDVVYNRAGMRTDKQGNVTQMTATDPFRIRRELEDLSEDFAKKGATKAENALRRKLNESNIIAAQGVQRRADEAEAKKTKAMKEILKYMPPGIRRRSTSL